MSSKPDVSSTFTHYITGLFTFLFIQLEYFVRNCYLSTIGALLSSNDFLDAEIFNQLHIKKQSFQLGRDFSTIKKVSSLSSFWCKLSSVLNENQISIIFNPTL